MSDNHLNELFRWNERTASLIQNLLVILMLTCFSVSLVQLGDHLVPEWRGGYLVFVCILIAIEASYSRRAMKSVIFFTPEWMRFRGVEWVMLLVGLKLAIYLVHGIDQLWVDIPLWRANFVDYFFTGEYIAAIAISFLIWSLAGIFTEDLMKLEGDEKILAAERASGIVEPRPEVRRKLANLTLVIGGVMICLSGLIRLESQALWGNTPPYSGGVLNVVVFFLLALILLSLTQFSVLRVHWSLQRIPLSRNLAVRWLIYSAAFLFIISIIAVVLPTNYSVGLLSMLGYLLSLLMSLISLLLVILITPLFFLLSLLARLMGRPEQVEPPDFSKLTPPPPPVAASSSLQELLKSLIFWAVFIGIIGYSLYHYIKQNEGLLEALRRFPLAHGLIRFWNLIKRWIYGVNRGVVASIDAGLKRLRERRSSGVGGNGWRFVNLRRLSPRQQVMFLFLALVRRSGERGIPRHPSQTPYEYSQTLQGQLPDVEGDLNIMTEQFVEALYSRHEITSDRVGFVQRCWQRIKHALRTTRSA